MALVPVLPTAHVCSAYACERDSGLYEWLYNQTDNQPSVARAESSCAATAT
jgi:hypothetical protein